MADQAYEASDYHMSGLEPETKQRFLDMADEYYAATGEPLKMESGYRSVEHQQRLYDEDIANNGGTPSGYVAKPGSSPHNFGEAIDLNKGQIPKLEELGLIDKYFTRPIMGQGASGAKEPWHIECPGSRDEQGVLRSLVSPNSGINSAEQASSAEGLGLADRFVARHEIMSQENKGPFHDTLAAMGLAQPDQVDPTDVDQMLKDREVPKPDPGTAPPAPLMGMEPIAPVAPAPSVMAGKTGAPALPTPYLEAKAMQEKITGVQDSLAPRVSPDDPAVQAAVAQNQMPLAEAYMKNIRAAARAMLAPMQGVNKAVNNLFPPGMLDAMNSKLEGKPEPINVDSALTETKTYPNEDLMTIPGKVAGSVAAYAIPGSVVGKLGAPASFLESLGANLATFMPVDIATGYRENGLEGAKSALIHSPITALAFTVGGLPSGNVGKTVGVGTAGAAAAAATGERDPMKLFEAFSTMAVLHQVMGTNPNPSAEVKKFVEDNHVTEPEMQGLREKITEATGMPPEDFQAVQQHLDQMTADREANPDQGATEADKLLQVETHKDAQDYAQSVYEAHILEGHPKEYAAEMADIAHENYVQTMKHIDQGGMRSLQKSQLSRELIRRMGSLEGSCRVHFLTAIFPRCRKPGNSSSGFRMTTTSSSPPTPRSRWTPMSSSKAISRASLDQTSISPGLTTSSARMRSSACLRVRVWGLFTTRATISLKSC